MNKQKIKNNQMKSIYLHNHQQGDMAKINRFSQETFVKVVNLP